MTATGIGLSDSADNDSSAAREVVCSRRSAHSLFCLSVCLSVCMCICSSPHTLIHPTIAGTSRPRFRIPERAKLLLMEECVCAPAPAHSAAASALNARLGRLSADAPDLRPLHTPGRSLSPGAGSAAGCSAAGAGAASPLSPRDCF